MIGNFLKKQSNKKKQIQILVTMIHALNINENQKAMYLNAIEIIDDTSFENLYREITHFVGNFEEKNIEEIQKKNFKEIAGMRKKEAVEKQKDVNAFTFLLNKL